MTAETRPGRLRFCGDLCHESYREDMRLGLVYGSSVLPDGRVVPYAHAAALAGLCSYCGAYVPTNVERRLDAMLEHPAGRELDERGSAHG